MLGALVIVFREVIEAGLIIGIVLGATRGMHGSRRFVIGGALAGLLGAGVVAAFAGAVAEAAGGTGQELLNAAVLALAVVMLAWHNIWMARHGRELAQELAGIGRAVAEGEKSFPALAIVVGAAVLREGAEVVLFLYGILASGESGASLLAGALGGLALGAATSSLVYFGLVSIPLRHFFSVTSALLTLLAAGLAAQCAGFLQEARIATGLSQVMWDTSAILSDTSALGRILRTLIGYTDQPTALQLLVYVGALIFIWAAAKAAAPGRVEARAPAE